MNVVEEQIRQMVKRPILECGHKGRPIVGRVKLRYWCNACAAKAARREANTAEYFKQEATK